jgi:5-methylcytosine-specific restriction endonuclease McrA
MRTSTANGTGGSKWISREIRLKIYARDNYTCLFCRTKVHTDIQGDILSLATLDHLNGKHNDNRRKNLSTVCFRCNSRKKDRDVDSFLSQITRDEGPYPSLWE